MHCCVRSPVVELKCMRAGSGPGGSEDSSKLCSNICVGVGVGVLSSLSFSSSSTAAAAAGSVNNELEAVDMEQVSDVTASYAEDGGNKE